MNTRASVREVNFDCLVGPTHHFGGLSVGNLASQKNKSRLSSPKQAALQGLKKMDFLRKRGFVQGVLPPHERPHMRSFKNLGFLGPDEVILKEAHSAHPAIFSSLCSSSSMWAANAATVSPSIDSEDNKLHITPANLITMFHRSIEHPFTERVLKLIFFDDRHFFVHDALMSHDILSDEGAANHNRLSPVHAKKGLQIFVYGKKSTLTSQKSSVYPSRQSSLANDSIIRRHRLDENYSLNIEQNPVAIDKGAFHNDVVCVVNEKVLLCHEYAFFDQHQTVDSIKKRFAKLYQQEPIIIEVSNKELSIEDAVSSYLFNSQVLTKPDGKMLLFAPTDCQRNRNANAIIDGIISDENPIDEVTYFDVSESMANGGGPACLRLRVLLTEQELTSIKNTVLLSDALFNDLDAIINKYYVDELMLEHFFDRKFLDNAKVALEQIAAVLGLGNIYDFQR